MTGICKFCGQTMMCEGITNQEYADEYATRNCKCDEGRNYRNIEDMKEEAKQNAEALFKMDEFETIQEEVKNENLLQMLNALIDSVAAGIIKKATVKLNERTTASIFITAKDGIRIKKNYKEEFVLEANRF